MKANAVNDPRSLPEVWNAVSTQAPWWAMAGCVAVGVTGIAALRLLDVDSPSSSIAFALIAIFGVRGFAARLIAVRPDARIWSVTRAAIDVAASLSAVVLLLSLLNALFAGGVGLIRA